MTDIERDRIRQYSFRKYNLMGPKSLMVARKKLCQKITNMTNIDEDALNEIINDTIAENDWSEPEALAYFECTSIEDRT